MTALIANIPNSDLVSTEWTLTRHIDDILVIPPIPAVPRCPSWRLSWVSLRTIFSSVPSRRGRWRSTPSSCRRLCVDSSAFRDRDDKPKARGRMGYPPPTRLLTSLSTATGRSRHTVPLSLSYVCPRGCFDKKEVDQVDLFKLAPRT